jgi:hypothetical protein
MNKHIDKIVVNVIRFIYLVCVGIINFAKLVWNEIRVLSHVGFNMFRFALTGQLPNEKVKKSHGLIGFVKSVPKAIYKNTVFSNPDFFKKK